MSGCAYISPAPLSLRPRLRRPGTARVGNAGARAVHGRCIDAAPAPAVGWRVEPGALGPSKNRSSATGVAELLGFDGEGERIRKSTLTRRTRHRKRSSSVTPPQVIVHRSG